MFLLQPIKDLLLSKKPEKAKDLLLQTMFSPDGLRVWHEVNKKKEIKIPLLLGFINKIKFSQCISTAAINTNKGVVLINPAFFCDKLESFSDYLFVLLHERMHAILKLIYGSLDSKFKTKDFCNFWEDVYINGSIIQIIDSDFHVRFFKKFEGFIGALSRQEIFVWLPMLEEIVKNLTIKDLSLRTHILELLQFIDPDDWVNCIGYYDWMGIGILVEQLFAGDKGIPEQGEDKKDQRFDLSDDAEEVNIEDITDASTKYEIIQPEPDLIFKIESPRSLSDFAKDLLHNVPEHELPDIIYEDLRNITRIRDMISKISTDLVGDLLATRQMDTVFEGKTQTFDTLSRKDLYLLSSGYCPVLWTKEISITTDDNFVLYMDVSGSMHQYYDLVPTFSTLLHEHCSLYFQFNEVIVAPECGVDPQSPFIYAGTGGTNYNKVADHIIEHGFSSIIIITDNTEKIKSKKRKILATQLQQLILLSLPISNEYKDYECRDDGFVKMVEMMGSRGTEIDLGDLRV